MSKVKVTKAAISRMLMLVFGLFLRVRLLKVLYLLTHFAVSICTWALLLTTLKIIRLKLSGSMAKVRMLNSQED